MASIVMSNSLGSPVIYQKRRLGDSTNTSFTPAWSQGILRCASRIYLPALEFRHPWIPQLVKSASVKERYWLSFSNDFTYIAFEDQIPTVLTPRISACLTDGTSSGQSLFKMSVKLYKESQKYWQGKFLSMNW